MGDLSEQELEECGYYDTGLDEIEFIARSQSLNKTKFQLQLFLFDH